MPLAAPPSCGVPQSHPTPRAGCPHHWSPGHSALQGPGTALSHPGSHWGWSLQDGKRNHSLSQSRTEQALSTESSKSQPSVCSHLEGRTKFTLYSHSIFSSLRPFEQVLRAVRKWAARPRVSQTQQLISVSKTVAHSSHLLHCKQPECWANTNPLIMFWSSAEKGQTDISERVLTIITTGEGEEFFQLLSSGTWCLRNSFKQKWKDRFNPLGCFL